jgi:hypothetical protein
MTLIQGYCLEVKVNMLIIVSTLCRPYVFTENMDWNNISHNCYTGPKKVSKP